MYTFRNLLKTVSFFALVLVVVNGCEKEYVDDSKPVENLSFTEEFDTVSKLYAKGWAASNFSVPQGTASWQQGVYESTKDFGAYSWSASGKEYIFANFSAGAGLAVCNSWLFTRPILMKNGDKFSFYTRSISGSFPDRLQVRLNPSDNSTDVGTQTALAVGKFTNLLLDINPTYTSTGYPTTWTKYELTISGLPNVTVGIPRRIAFRYFVENGGPSGANSNAIGLDLFKFESQ